MRSAEAEAGESPNWPALRSRLLATLGDRGLAKNVQDIVRSVSNLKSPSPVGPNEDDGLSAIALKLKATAFDSSELEFAVASDRRRLFEPLAVLDLSVYLSIRILVHSMLARPDSFPEHLHEYLDKGILSPEEKQQVVDTLDRVVEKLFHATEVSHNGSIQ